MSLGAPLGSAIGAFAADSWRRKPTIVGASLLTIVLGGIYPFLHQPAALLTSGFLLTIPIYILVATLFAIYIPELFPTEVRLRASGNLQHLWPRCNDSHALPGRRLVPLLRHSRRPQSDDRLSHRADRCRLPLRN